MADGGFYFDLVEPEAMKNRLNEVSMDNWMHCVDEALRKSGTKADGSPYTRDDVSYLDMLLVKPSAHLDMLTAPRPHRGPLQLPRGRSATSESRTRSSPSTRASGRVRCATAMSIAMVGAGIGYVWAAGILHWGPAED